MDTMVYPGKDKSVPNYLFTPTHTDMAALHVEPSDVGRVVLRTQPALTLIEPFSVI